jgi:hypothetical protein
MKVLIVYYSMYGHINRMAEAIAEGAKTINGAEVVLRRVPETLPQEVLVKMGAVEAQKKFENVPIATVEELASADAIIWYTNSFWQHVRSNAAILGRYRRAMGKGCFGRKGGQRLHQFRNSARRAGIHFTKLSHHTIAPWICYCWTSIQFPRANA